MTDSSGTRKFFYDRDNVIQEYDSDWSTVTKEYTHGPWVDEPLSMTEHATGQPNSTYYLMKDRLGSIINILDENETLKTTYSYDAFGEPTATYHSGQVDCTYRFAGREFDSGMGNYFSRARYYNQSLGRFFSRDPIMSLQSPYAYCGNSPENVKDPTGRWGSVLTPTSGAGEICLDEQGWSDCMKENNCAGKSDASACVACCAGCADKNGIPVDNCHLACKDVGSVQAGGSTASGSLAGAVASSRPRDYSELDRSPGPDLSFLMVPGMEQHRDESMLCCRAPRVLANPDPGGDPLMTGITVILKYSVKPPIDLRNDVAF